MARSNTWTTLLLVAAISLTVLARPEPSNGSSGKHPKKKTSTKMERETQAKKLQKVDDKYLDNMAETLAEWLVESNDLQKLHERIQRSVKSDNVICNSVNSIDDDTASPVDGTSDSRKMYPIGELDVTDSLLSKGSFLTFNGGCPFKVEMDVEEDRNPKYIPQVTCQCDAASCPGGTWLRVFTRIPVTRTGNDKPSEMDVSIGCKCVKYTPDGPIPKAENPTVRVS